MERNNSAERPSWSARCRMAFRVVFDSDFAGQVMAGLRVLRASDGKAGLSRTKPADSALARTNDSGLFVLSALQREGRLIDFLQQDVAGFSDDQVGAAARVVHAGCSRALKQYFQLEPAVPGIEGSNMTVPQGFDAQRIQLTGNVTGQPPFKGTLKHHGWIAREVRLPAKQETLDPRVIAPAEVELA